MEMRVSFPIEKVVGSKIWEAKLSPRDVRRLKESPNGFGAVSVLILSASPVIEGGRIQFDADAASIVNVGSTDRIIVIDGTTPKSALERFRTETSNREVAKRKFSPGDQLFLNGLGALPKEVSDAGTQLLTQIRTHFHGELRRVSDGRFQETPDNFWFATIQPRVKSILITVRGMPDRFKPSTLNILEDRRPYSRFKVQSQADVTEAFRIIKGAIRRVR